MRTLKLRKSVVILTAMLTITALVFGALQAGAAGLLGHRASVASSTLGGLTADELDTIIEQAVAAAEQEISGLRVGADGNMATTKMHIAIVNRQGNLIRLYSMEDAWVGSINIAIGKARTAAYFSSNENALTSRSIGELSQPGGALWQIGNSNQAGEVGLIQFPGGVPLYKDGELVGGIGVSGDGVDQDENVAVAGAAGFEPDPAIRIDTLTGGAILYTLYDAMMMSHATVMISGNDELGEFLVAANGMTLYLFTRDEGGESVCYEQCAINWPPLIVASEDELLAGDGVTGELGVTERTDGTLQVTYNGMPLYFWINDQQPGDTTGHGVGNVWFVVEP